MRNTRSAIAGLLLVVALACNQQDGADQTPCTAGQTLACVTPAGCVGSQICAADGHSASACVCPPPIRPVDSGTDTARATDAGTDGASDGAPDDGAIDGGASDGATDAPAAQ